MRTEQGLTLIEMLVSILLLAIVALGSASLLTVTVHQNQLAHTRSLATNLAAERIELLTSQTYEPTSTAQAYRLPDEVFDAGPPATFTSDYGTITGHEHFRRVMTLNYDVPVAGMLQVTTEVTWQDLKEGEKRHTLITYVHPALEQGL